MPQEELTSGSDLERQSTANLASLAVGTLLFLVAVLLGGVIYALGQSADSFRWETFISGGRIFLLVLLGVSTAGLAIAFLLRVLSAVFPQAVRSIPARRRLRQARRRAVSMILQRHRRHEEQARLTAMMQASYLYERESARMANSQGIREFQKALQSGIVRSCEVVFAHLNQVVDQYEQLINEIQESSLDDAEKAELLESLARNLNVSSLDQRHRAARRMMEDAVWKVRLRKARLLARRNPETARKYLLSVRLPETSHRILIQIDALMKELPSDSGR